MQLPLANPSLAEVLDQHTAVGSLCHAEDDRLRCVACGHRCLIGDGKRGICKVRYNEGGQLRVPFGYVAGLQCDPVEKKPFFHVYPSSDALTFGMMGCDLHCSYCQNWVTSQALRDSAAVAPVRPVSAAQLVEVAQREGARLVVSSYNEPLITAEWAVAVFQQAKKVGLACAFVSNGNATPEVLDFLAPWIVAYKVDLKSFDDRHYRTLGGTLANITDTIRMIHERGLWLEIVTLVIPGFNDSERELRESARFLASVSKDVPWHVTAFHKDYRMTDPEATSPQALMRACEIGVEEGLRYVYAGNLPGRVGPWENTRCPGCGDTLIERFGYLIRSYRLSAEGACPRCQTRLPGIWPGEGQVVKTGNDQAAYVKRLPRVVATPIPDRETGRQGDREMGNTTLTDEQKQHLVGATGDLVRALATGQRAAFADPSLGGAGDQMVAGAFVSLKRGKHLRACCGMLGPAIPLRTALTEAAVRSVYEDVRFPPVSPSEVEHLDMEIWLLQGPERVEARGDDRLGAVTIGKHGIKVVRGEQQALFLPSVALDLQWDARKFLDRVCLKAGMNASAWRDDATALYVFEGQVLHGKLAGPEGPKGAERRPAICRPEDLPVFANFCSNNINALVSGITPSYYLFGAPDGEVSGVVLALQHAGGARVFCQLSLRPGLPLQSTLFALCQSAAQVVAAEPGLAQARVGVTIMHDPVLLGTVAEHDLAGVDPAHRAFLVLERNKSGIVFDPNRQPAELLAEAARQAAVTQPAAAAVYSLDALAHGPFALSTAPKPMRGPAIRPPAVAGTFYPADANQLAALVDDLLRGERAQETWSAAMVPHAGLIYSGHIAANVLKRLKIPRTVVVIGPKHTALGVDWAVAPHQTWTFPGGRLESDVELAQKLCAAIPGLELDAAAHHREHAVEVELPFLAKLAPETRVVGIAIGAGDLESCRRFAAGLAGILKEREERPLLLISSDMNHYASDAENRRLDAIALASLESLDPAAIYETVTENHISMCGLLPAVIVLETLRLLGTLRRAQSLGYATSAEVSGDKSRVVGYAGMLFG